MTRAPTFWVFLAAALTCVAVADDEPWIITGDEVITEPTEVGHVILALGGSLTVTGVPEPGLQVEGNIWALGSSEVVLEDSVIQFMSTYHGQYALAIAENASARVTGCDYRVPSGVQHGLVAAQDAELVIEDTDFGSVQLVTVHDARIEARRLNGNFEVIVQNDSHMVLEDIPRDEDAGSVWVWVEFPPGSDAVYTPPMPGFVDSWSFPPPDATGIEQTAEVTRCEALLWPMLVREESVLELRDISEDNWVVVGFHLPESTEITGLENDTLYVDTELGLADRTIRLVNASIDTWNIYPEEDARVDVSDSVLGEILSMGSSEVRMSNTTIDGTGGFFGARDSSRIIATDCFFTCTIEATQESTIELYSSDVQPYPADPTGAWTRFGAYDQGRLLADHTPIATTPALGGEGLIAVVFLANPPAHPPAAGEMWPLWGSIGLFSLDGGPTPGEWRLDAVSRLGGQVELIAAGQANVEEGWIGDWQGTGELVDQQLRVVLTDSLGRTLIGGQWVPGTADPVREGNPAGRRP